MISPDSERTMNTHLGINRDYSPAELNPEAIAESDYFFFTGYMWDTPKQKAALTRAMEIAKESGTKIVFDAADPFAVRRHHGEFLHLIENHFDVVLANREEARLIFDCDDIDICVEKLGSLCDTAIVKDGPRGSIISHRGGIYPSKDKACLVSTTCPVSTYRIPVNKVEAVDTTGAGDIYAAGFLYGLCRGWPTPGRGSSPPTWPARSSVSPEPSFPGRRRCEYERSWRTGAGTGLNNRFSNGLKKEIRKLGFESL